LTSAIFGDVTAAASEAREIVELLMGMTHRMRELFAARAADHDLTPAQASALLQLDEPLSQRELAARIRYDASNVTSIADGLERRGLIDRQIDPADRRVRRLVLTKRGATVAERLRDALSVKSGLFDGLTRAERQVLRDLLTKMLEQRGAVLTTRSVVLRGA
jgi:DNA-binding MarR family transcriptional regulator